MIRVNLAVLLAERSIKISELAKRTGISRTTLTALYYNQSKGIQFDTLDTLCTYLKVKPDQLILHESFSYDFEVLSMDDTDQTNIIIQCKAKIVYNSREIQDVMTIDCGFDGSDIIDAETKRELQILDYIHMQVLASNKIRDVVLALPSLVRTAFEDDLGNEIMFFLSKDLYFAPEVRMYVSFDKINLDHPI